MFVHEFFRPVIFLLLALAGCNAADNSRKIKTVPEETGNNYYVEIRNARPEIQNCLSHALFNKQTSTTLKQADFKLKTREITEPFTGKSAPGNHVFLDFNSLPAETRPANAEKITIKFKYNEAGQPIAFSIEVYTFEYNNSERRILNLGDFAIRDKAGNPVTPGTVGIKEVCDQVCRLAIMATYP